MEERAQSFKLLGSREGALVPLGPKFAQGRKIKLLQESQFVLNGEFYHLPREESVLAHRGRVKVACSQVGQESLPGFFEGHSRRSANGRWGKITLCLPIANNLLGLLPICRPQSFVDSFTIHAPINPDRTRAAEMPPTLGPVGAMFLVSAKKAKHIDVYYIIIY
jgi:hypothetical protein